MSEVERKITSLLPDPKSGTAAATLSFQCTKHTHQCWQTKTWTFFGHAFLIVLPNLSSCHHDVFHQPSSVSAYDNTINLEGPMKKTLWAKFYCLAAINQLLVCQLWVLLSIFVCTIAIDKKFLFFHLFVLLPNASRILQLSTTLRPCISNI